MNNDFIEGMEILIRCKQYVEHRLEALYKMAEKRNQFGQDPTGFKNEIARCEYALGYLKSFNVEEE